MQAALRCMIHAVRILCPMFEPHRQAAAPTHMPGVHGGKARAFTHLQPLLVGIDDPSQEVARKPQGPQLRRVKQRYQVLVPHSLGELQQQAPRRAVAMAK